MSLFARLLALLSPGRSSAPAAPAVVVAPQPRPVEAPPAAPPIPVAVVGDAPRPAPAAAGLVIERHRLRGGAFDASPHIGGVIVPRFIVMHYTAGGTAQTSVEAIRNRFLSAHFFVDRSGAVIQTVDCNREAYHAGESRWRGVSGLNAHSIGIEVSNFGWFDQREGDGWVRDGLSRVMRPDQVLVARHRSGGKTMAWELYPEVQLAVLDRLTRAILAAYPTVREVVGHDDISPGRKLDPGPAFPIARYQAMAPG